ncbi:MAG: STM4013/SEN3800 family hydrolase [Myxococcales bacterium]|nr:STM4013/SEN3800 family hydrolase [Myxococcales bacterium]MCB9668438.1 STM4013/SEN3800 family hydrolase [Alphaproteobacteria bacterium]MCB9690676.1 STM4013/SEN3800 family hydrolase [Alphaproteobacteria bacterium]
MRSVLGRHDVLFVTLDTLRYDVAVAALEAGELPVLSRYVDAWEERHSPATFTYAAHAAFFAGFLPTPVTPGPHIRELAVAFGGSETIGPHTTVFDAPDIVRGFADAGYHTICVGGTGFFNPATPLGTVLPGLFAESRWETGFGVTDPHSTEHQVAWLVGRLAELDGRVLAFVNVSAIHQPNRHYVDGAETDSLATHRAALRYVDGALAPLFAAFAARGPTEVMVTSDHGTLYGEGGHVGHRVAHPHVLTVPWARFTL